MLEPGQQLLDPDQADQHLGQGRAHAPVALRLEHHQRARVGDREVGAADADTGPQEPLAQVPAGGLGQVGGAVAEPRLADRRRNRSRISVRLRWMAGTRMCDDQSSSSCRISSARSVSTASTPRSASASLRPISSLVSDFTLTTSRAPWPSTMPAMTSFASAASRAQCTVAPARWRRARTRPGSGRGSPARRA